MISFSECVCSHAIFGTLSSYIIDCRDTGNPILQLPGIPSRQSASNNMGSRTLPSTLLLLIPLAAANAVPRDIQEVLQPAPLVPEHPAITPAPASTNWRPTRTIQRRDILSDVKSNANSVLSQLGSNIPSFVASGVPNFFQDFPTGDKVQSSLGLDDAQVSALPTQVLNVP